MKWTPYVIFFISLQLAIALASHCLHDDNAYPTIMTADEQCINVIEHQLHHSENLTLLSFESLSNYSNNQSLTEHCLLLNDSLGNQRKCFLSGFSLNSTISARACFTTNLLDQTECKELKLFNYDGQDEAKRTESVSVDVLSNVSLNKL